MMKDITNASINYYLLKDKSVRTICEKHGFRYLGNSISSSKMRKSYNHGTETYCIYLAPSNLSGYNTCPNSLHCKEYCLFNSGQNKLQQLSNNNNNRINNARINKTKLFYENRDLFMKILITEIIQTQQHAIENNLDFAVRLNGTSDISPEEFIYQDKNILQWFPNIQFYDYTKVYNRIKLLDKYDNYDLTYSFNGYNWKYCEKFLKQGGKVAVVFETKQLPKYFNNYPVINGNNYDMRYLDPNSSIIGLTYHKTSKDYVNHTYITPNTPFIIK